MDAKQCGICGVYYSADKELYKATKEVEGKDVDITLNAFRFGSFNKKTGQWNYLTSDNDICPKCAMTIDDTIEHLAGERKIQYHKAKIKSGRYSNKNVAEASDKTDNVLKEQAEFAKGQEEQHDAE